MMRNPDEPVTNWNHPSCEAGDAEIKRLREALKVCWQHFRDRTDTVPDTDEQMRRSIKREQDTWDIVDAALAAAPEPNPYRFQEAPYLRVFELLYHRRIVPKKAAEAIAEYQDGKTPVLPDDELPDPETSPEPPSESLAQTLQDARDEVAQMPEWMRGDSPKPEMGMDDDTPEDPHTALQMPYFICRCGTVSYPLTDDTRCKCQDIYEREWMRVETPWVLLTAMNHFLRPEPHPDTVRFRPLREWHEDDGSVLWWHIDEETGISDPPYVGDPLCSDWLDCWTHWEPIANPTDEQIRAAIDGIKEES